MTNTKHKPEFKTPKDLTLADAFASTDFTDSQSTREYLAAALLDGFYQSLEHGHKLTSENEAAFWKHVEALLRKEVAEKAADGVTVA